MDLVKRSISKWINAAIVLTLGIMLIIAGAAYDKEAGVDAMEGISLVLGIILIVVGALALTIAVVGGILAKTGFAAAGTSAGITLALGISLVAGKYAYGMITLILYIIPFLLIVVGAILLADAIYNLVLAIIRKGSIVPQIVSIVIGTVAVVLGALCIGGQDAVIPLNVQVIVLGIVFVVYAIVMVLSTFFKLPTVVVVTTEKEVKKAE